MTVEWPSWGVVPGQGRRAPPRAAKRGVGVPILSVLERSEARVEAPAKLGAPLILDAAPPPTTSLEVCERLSPLGDPPAPELHFLNDGDDSDIIAEHPRNAGADQRVKW
ncbi:hypothetical protein A6768_11755 [Sphingobium yanoikuyae]|uniref:Uncharacterized protein n=1 Tax=Sphingobium yanoikuyae TaxID=13690 RepID=A0A291MZS0_SPHYA|nr:hypothetical protein A6768_11755 [Sphingobium yanoikuyae]